MRQRTAIIGYNSKKVLEYASLLETELMLLEQQRREERQSFMLAQAELLYEIDNLKQNLSELDNLESGLKRWIQRNQ